MLFSEVVCIFCCRELRCEGTGKMKLHVRRVEEQRLWTDWGRRLTGSKGSVGFAMGLEIERLRESRGFSLPWEMMKVCFLGWG